MSRDYYEKNPPEPDDIPEDALEDKDPEPMFDTEEERDGKR